MAIAELKNNEVFCKIAKLGDLAVGFYLLKTHACPVPLDGKSTELKQIYILSDHYGKGLGKMLYEDAINTIKQNGSSHVWLCVSDINHRAKAFYNKLAFRAVGTGPVFIVGSDRLTSTVMTSGI
jgi:ribosomal protein S18 acetylase RimI-like enzyme